MKKLKNKADVLKPEVEDLKNRKFTIKVANTLKIEMAEQSSKLQHTTASHHVTSCWNYLCQFNAVATANGVTERKLHH